jgi:hypothetical protein
LGRVTLIDRARRAGLDMSVDPDGRLVVTGPRRAEAVAREVLARKAEVLAELAPPPVWTKSAADEAWEKLAAMRWGPAVGVAEGGIVAEPDWRWTVANLPHEEWVRWRRAATRRLDGVERPSVWQVHEADREAAEAMGISTRG